MSGQWGKHVLAILQEETDDLIISWAEKQWLALFLERLVTCGSVNKSDSAEWQSSMCSNARAWVKSL